jgi:hypothetical protein
MLVITVPAIIIAIIIAAIITIIIVFVAIHLILNGDPRRVCLGDTDAKSRESNRRSGESSGETKHDLLLLLALRN